MNKIKSFTRKLYSDKPGTEVFKIILPWIFDCEIGQIFLSCKIWLLWLGS